MKVQNYKHRWAKKEQTTCLFTADGAGICVSTSCKFTRKERKKRYIILFHSTFTRVSTRVKINILETLRSSLNLFLLIVIAEF